MRPRVLLASVLLAALLATAAPATAQDPNPDAPNWVVTVYEVTFTELDHAILDGTLNFHKLTYEGTTYSAREARDLYHDAYAVDPQSAEDLVDDMEAQITARVETVLASTLPGGENATVSPAELDRSTLNTTEGDDPYHPPLVFNVTADVPVDLQQVSGDADPGAVDALLAVGAKVGLEVPLTAQAGTNVTFQIAPPEGLAFSDEGAVSRTLRNWQGDGPASSNVTLAIWDEAATRYEAEDIDLTVTLDLTGLDLTLLQLPGGRAGTAIMDVRLAADVAVLPLPPEKQAELPASVDLTHVSSDQIRLLLAEGLLTRDDLQPLEDLFLGGFRELVEERTDAAVTGGLQESSLGAPPGTGDLDGDPPLALRAESHIEFPLELPSQGPNQVAAVTLFDLQREVPFEPIENFTTTYEVVLPRGVALLDAHAVDGPGSVLVERSDDGRDVLRVTTADEPTSANVHVALLPSFLLYQTWELLAIALVALLLPILLVARAVRKRRRRKDGGNGGGGAGGGGTAEGGSTSPYAETPMAGGDDPG